MVNFFTDVTSSVVRHKHIMLKLFFSGCNVFNVYIVVLFKLKICKSTTKFHIWGINLPKVNEVVRVKDVIKK